MSTAPEHDPFEPTLAAARARLDALRPEAYARTRNHLEGAVTRLSPYLTHGYLSLAQVLHTVCERHALGLEHKFVQELGWRAFFHHAWRHRGEGIFASLHAGPLPDHAYAPELPQDIRRGATGVPVIDHAVRTLYATGWLHNHARMWLASYVVHLRKVHWRAGADWLYAHLLDGDLASNHLSWQWIAGTGSHKPYLFNAENVARYAPAAWHSPRSVIDTSYERLDTIARSDHDVGGGRGEPVDEPALHHAPPAACGVSDAPLPRGAWLAHPWALGEPPAGVSVAGVFFAGFHRRWAWSERRWRFVTERLRELGATPHWVETVGNSVGRSLADPHATPWLGGVDLISAPAAFEEPKRVCGSFTQYWRGVHFAVTKPA